MTAAPTFWLLGDDPKAVAHALAQLQRQRAARRDVQPMPAGGLFDRVTRAQSDLF